MWKSAQAKKQLDIEVDPFEQFTPGIASELEAETADIVRFLGITAAHASILTG